MMRLYRDPETGRVYEYIRDAINAYCCKECDDCHISIGNNQKHLFCFEYVSKFPIEAAHLMGYEVIDDSSTDSSTPLDDTPTPLDHIPTTVDDTPTGQADTPTGDKPRLAEVLGVEVGEKIRILGGCYHTVEFRIEKNGLPSTDVYPALIYAINHPDSIIRAPRLTESEIAIMRALGAKWVSRDGGPSDDGWLSLWAEKPESHKGLYYVERGCSLARVHQGKFPSVGPGECVGLEENGR